MSDKLRKLLLFGLFLLFLNVCKAVKINSITVPQRYEIKDDTEPLIFNCDFTVSDADTGFVLKWLHNNIAIYQWIPSKHPFGLGHFKGRVDLNYTLPTNDRLKKHSALVITKPLLTDSGNYTCSVQTFQGADRKTDEIQIIDPEDSIDLSYQFEADGMVKLKCSVYNIYPVPEVDFLLDNKELNSANDKDVQQDTELFNITVTTVLNKTEIVDDSPMTCVVKIPNTDYIKQEHKIYDENNAEGIRLSSTAMFSSLLLVVATFARF
ncbi:CLUMA_CG017577, isoform B [Clunio marinus]|uniref:CLUMA_CG017577, isoform B n=1 Tax=Clunio marinus TaxID=568069 RepID=A0A1J1J0W9_9DIPT|nr:CLUMA_CG017577, isoform B [Clunio marinus]